jgi:hypothetical protein
MRYFYWSSTTNEGGPLNAWSVMMSSGDMWLAQRTSPVNLVWPVRDP